MGGCQNKHFGTFSQMNITRGLVLSVAQATLSLRSIRLPEMCYFRQLVESMQPLRPYEKEDTLKQFLQFDRNVLRFYCLWDDSDR